MSVLIAVLLFAPVDSRSDERLVPWAPHVVNWLRRDRSSLDVDARVLAPSRCHVATGTIAGSPPDRRTRADLAPLQLVVHTPPGSACPPGETILSFRHERLPFSGKDGVMVYVVLDGRVVGQVQSLF